MNKPREQNTRTRRDTRDIRFALLSVRGPWSYLRLLSVCSGPWWSRNGRSNPRFHDCAGSAVCARGGGGQDSRASRQCVVELPRTRAMHVHIRSSHLRASARRHLPHRPRVHSCGPVPTSHAPRMAPLDRISDARLGMPSRAAVPVLHIWARALNPRRSFNLRC